MLEVLNDWVTEYKAIAGSGEVFVSHFSDEYGGEQVEHKMCAHYCMLLLKLCEEKALCKRL